jgi:drug/metabolite transporter (DMT)-like permease
VDSVCHRCSAAINSSELFCQHCGAPQLRYEALDDATTPSAIPTQMLGRDPGVVLWKDAIIAAMIVAVPVGIFSWFSDGGLLFGIAGGIATISLYRRRTGLPPAGRTGWRIGGLLGVMAAFVAMAFYSIASVVQRYLLHDGASIDQRVHELTQRNIQVAEMMYKSSPETAAMLPWVERFWNSPDGMAAVILAGVFSTAFAIMLFSAAGGALGARIGSIRIRPQRSS